MAFSAGEIEAIFKMRDQLTKELKRVTVGLRQAGKTAQDVGRQFEQVGTKVQSAGSAMLPFSAAFAAGAVAAFKFGNDFDVSMTKIITLVGIGADEVERMRKQVLSLAGTTGKAPQELADALFVVTSAGARGAEALEILEAAAKASAVGLGATEDIARAVTSALTAYGSENLSASQATNVLFKTVREGNLNAGELASSLGRVIGVAAEMGVSFADVGAVVATYTRLGVSAEEATTGLRSVLTGLLAPTTEAAKVLKSVGLSAEGLRRQIKDEGLPATLVGLSKAFKGNTEALAGVIPNVRALSTVLGVAGSQSESFLQIARSIASENDALAEGFATVAETVDFKFNKALTDLQTTAISTFEAFKGQFAFIIEGFTKIVESGQRAVDVLEVLSPTAKNVVASLVAIGAVAAPALIVLGSAIRLVAFSMQGLGIAAVKTTGVMFAFANSVPILTARLAFMQGGVTALAVLVGTGLKVAFLALAPAMAIAAGAFALFKFAEFTGAVAEVREQIVNLALRMQGLSDAEIDAFKQDQALAEGLRGTATVARGLTVAVDASTFTMEELETVLGRLSDTGQITQAIVAQMVDRARALHADGEQLTPTMARLVAQFDQNAEAAARAAGTFSELSKEAQTLLDQLSDSALAGDVANLEAAFAQLTAAGDVDRLTLARVAVAANELQKRGGALSDVLVTLGDEFRRLNESLESTNIAFSTFQQRLPSTTNALGLFNITLEDVAVAGRVATAGMERFADSMKPSMFERIKGSFKDMGATLRAQFSPANIISNIVTGGLEFVGQQISKLIGKGLSALGGFLKTALFGRSVKEQVTRLGGQLGLTFSEAMTKVIEEQVKAGADQMVAILTNLGGIISEAGGVMAFGFALAANRAKDLFSIIEQGKATMDEIRPVFFQVFSELVDNLDKADAAGLAAFNNLVGAAERFGISVEELGAMVREKLTGMMSGLITEAIKAGGIVPAEFDRMIEKAQELGVATAEIATFFEANWAKAVDGMVSALNSGVALSTGTLEGFASAAFASFNAMVDAGVPLIEALEKMQPLWKDLRARMVEAGLQGTESFRQMNRWMRLVNDETLGPLIKNALAFGRIIEGLANTGALTQQAFNAFGRDVVGSFARMQDAGLSQRRSLIAIRPTIQALWEAQQKFKFTVNEATQEVIDQGLAAGVIGPQFKSAADQQVEAMQRVVQLLERLVQILGSDIPAAAHSGAQQVERDLNGIRIDPIVVPVSFDVGKFPKLPGRFSTEFEELQHGGIVRRPTLALLGEAGPEAVIPLGAGGQTIKRDDDKPPREIRIEIPVILDGVELDRRTVRVSQRALRDGLLVVPEDVVVTR